MDYQDMYELPRPVLKHLRMDISHRAKQFVPFAALKGFEECIREREFVYNRAVEEEIQHVEVTKDE